jgi:hypothetical protein
MFNKQNAPINKLIMKKLISLFISLAFAGSSFAQMSGYSTSQSQGTTLGANETLIADGIALGNAVKLRGYVDFIFGYDDEDGGDQNEQFDTTADIDFLFDLSPITAEVHLNTDQHNHFEQVFGRYSVNDDFHVTFGRQLTVLGFEADEAPGLYAVTTAHVLGSGDSDIDMIGVQTRRNYVDGVRLNYNNGMFGLTFGLHDGYWSQDHFDGDDLAIDLAASVMFFPGLEARLGYAHESLDEDSTGANDGDIGQFNAWLAYNPGALTLATEFDNYDIDLGTATDTEYWSWMLLANYQFTDWFAATFRYTHEDVEQGNVDHDSDRFTFATLFTLTDNFGVNVEYSTTSVDSTAQGDYDEFLVEGLITY